MSILLWLRTGIPITSAMQWKSGNAGETRSYDLADAIVEHLGYPADLAQADTIGHFGGELTPLDGDVKASLFEPIMALASRLMINPGRDTAARREVL
jgi:hypothetical protein